jgi:Holliday junction resolvase
MTTQWAERKAVGDALEARVAGLLRARGWNVDQYGQGTLSGQVRDAVRRSDSALRWMPDLIAQRGDRLVTVDCKASMSAQTRRHAIARRAVQAHALFASYFEIAVYYVFDNLGVLTPVDVLGAARPGPPGRGGSGSDYYLIGFDLDRPFDLVFGRQAAGAAAA